MSIMARRRLAAEKKAKRKAAERAEPKSVIEPEHLAKPKKVETLNAPKRSTKA